MDLVVLIISLKFFIYKEIVSNTHFPWIQTHGVNINGQWTILVNGPSLSLKNKREAEIWVLNESNFLREEIWNLKK
jgi:hypothetical protein